jgi:hypothetical protein
VVLMAPAATIFWLVSANPQVAYLRYLLPAFSFVFILLGKAAAPWQPRMLRQAAVAGLCWSVCASLCNFPFSLSYFNELAGGPLGGPRYLLDAEVDWGQDLFHLVRWREKHPEATPLSCHVTSAAVPLTLFGLESTGQLGGARRFAKGAARSYDTDRRLVCHQRGRVVHAG